MLKICTFNVNGIRSVRRKGFDEWLEDSQPDILCLQEIRGNKTMFPNTLIDKLNYQCYIHSAKKAGYSGVAILTKKKPISLRYGIDTEWIDEEGRIMMLEYPAFRIASVYAPSGSSGEHRQSLKMKFLDVFMNYIKLYANDTKPILFCGDINICHRSIDIHNPIQNKNSSGFLPEERAWMDAWFDVGYVDVFRQIYPNLKDQYTWWSFRARSRERNKGWRIDYHVASPMLSLKVQSAIIEKEKFLSDHAPLTMVYDYSW